MTGLRVCDGNDLTLVIADDGPRMRSVAGREVVCLRAPSGNVGLEGADVTFRFPSWPNAPLRGHGRAEDAPPRSFN